MAVTELTWLNNLDEAFDLSSRSGEPVFVDFFSPH